MNFEIPRVPCHADPLFLENLYPSSELIEKKEKDLLRLQKKIGKRTWEAEELIELLKQHKLLQLKAWQGFKTNLDHLSLILFRLNKELVRLRKTRNKSFF